jgi:hypothetical protein
MNKGTPGADGDGRADERDAPPDRPNAVTRRRLVASGAAAWATVSLTGCQYITDPGVDTATESPTPTVTTETTTTDTPTPTPTRDPDATPTPTRGPDATPTPTDTPTPSPTPTPTPTAPATTTACSSIDEFVPGMEVGVHVGVYDSETGEPLGDDELAAVTVAFPDADYDERELNWRGAHERYDERTWGTKVVTHPEAEPGVYNYEVSVAGEDGDLRVAVTDRFVLVG